jgi:hypothetical protein
MSGMDLGIRIFFGVLMLVIFLVHLYYLIYAWHHLDAEDVLSDLYDIKRYNMGRKVKKEIESRAIDRTLWGE